MTDATVQPLAKGQAPANCSVLTCDLSRSGLSILHEKQLFPGQLLELKSNGQTRPVEVA